MHNLLLRIAALFTLDRRAPVLGHASLVPNRAPRIGATANYYRLPIVVAGERRYLLLTPREVVDASERARLNPEECPKIFSNWCWPVLHRGNQ